MMLVAAPIADSRESAVKTIAASTIAQARSLLGRCGAGSVERRTASVTQRQTIATSNPVATTSAKPIVSRCHGSGPNGSPVVRDAIHAATIKAFPTAPIHKTPEVGHHIAASAQASCATPLATK